MLVPVRLVLLAGLNCHGGVPQVSPHAGRTLAVISVRTRRNQGSNRWACGHYSLRRAADAAATSGWRHRPGPRLLTNRGPVAQ